MDKIKILLNIPFQISHEKLLWMVEQFEKNGFEVVEESTQYAGCFLTEIPAEIIDKSMFVVTVNDLLFYQQVF